MLLERVICRLDLYYLFIETEYLGFASISVLLLLCKVAHGLTVSFLHLSQIVAQCLTLLLVLVH